LDTSGGWALTDYYASACTGELKDRDVEVVQGKDDHRLRKGEHCNDRGMSLEAYFIPPRIEDEGNQR